MMNLYCDESCHLENDGFKVMLIGGVACPDYARKRIYLDIKQIKNDHNISPLREIKWSKVSNSEQDYYKSLIDYFFSNELLSFRCVLLPDKSVLRHHDFDQTHDDFYYKMYYYVIRKYLNETEPLKVFLDIKDTQSIQKVRKLGDILGRAAGSRFEKIDRIQQIRSHENSILQLADLLLGAVGYVNRDLKSSTSKVFISQYIAEKAQQSLKNTSRYSENKFNIFVLDKI